VWREVEVRTHFTSDLLLFLKLFADLSDSFGYLVLENRCEDEYCLLCTSNIVDLASPSMGIHMFAGYTRVDAVAESWMRLMAEAETLLSSLPVLGGDRNYEVIPQLVHGLRKHNEEYDSVVEWYRSSLTQWAELGIQLSSRRDGVPEGTYDMDILPISVFHCV
jgi:hypothetical protein